MRIHIGYQAAILILALFAGSVSAATYTKPVSMPTASATMAGGTPNMAANILEVGMQGVEFIPSSASESRAVANITKGLSIPTSGIVSSLKSGLKANLPSLIVSGAIAGIVAGVDWIEKDGQLVKKDGSTSGSPVVYDPSGGLYGWRNERTGALSSNPITACGTLSSEYWDSPAPATSLVAQDPVTFACVHSAPYGAKWGSPSDYTERGTSVHRTGDSCPTASSYNSTTGTCVGTGVTYAPLTDSDYDVLDGFVQGKDGVWMRGLADEVCKTSSDYDSCIANMGAKPYLSGPSTVSSPEVTTQTQTQNPDGTSTEVSTKTRTDYQLGYPSSSPGSITVDPKTTTTTTTTQKDANGNTTSTGTKTDTTTTTQPGSGTQLSDGVFTDTPFPDVSPFYTQKFPGGFKDVWAKNKAAFDSSPFVSFLNSFVPSFSGSCPTWAMSFDIMPYAHFGSRQFGSLCYIFVIIKVIMLVTAMFTCRAIIFGG